jgi:hypothetical protein
MASVISTYARFQAMKPARGLQNEGERLVMALASLRPKDPHSFIDHLLISRAFHDVGFRTQAIENLTIASNKADSVYWRNRIHYELAEMLYQAGDLQKADQALAGISHSAHQRLRVKMMLLDARVKLELGRMPECELLCKSLLELHLNEETKKQTLELLGNAYQRSGKHYSAAICFAGLLPDSEGMQDTQMEQKAN